MSNGNEAAPSGQPPISQHTESEIRRVINQAVLEAADQFIGLVGTPFDQLDLFNDLYGPWAYSGGQFVPPYYWQSQKRGEVIPIYLNELQLRWIRDRQRRLCAENPYAQCAIANLQNYAAGEAGLTFEVVPAHPKECTQSHLHQTQRIIDVWDAYNDMAEYVLDMVEAAVINSDVITRHFPQDDGIVEIRRVEAEHLRSPVGDGYGAEYSFGIQTPPDDVQHTIGYWIVDNPLEKPTPSFVPADEVTFLKFNTPRSAKRGLPLFHSTELFLRGAVELLRATMATVTMRAKIAMIRKFNGVVKDAAAKLVSELTTQTVTDPVNGQVTSMQKMPYGGILNSSVGVEHEFPAQNFETNIHQTALDMVLGCIASRIGFARWMLTGNASGETFSNAFIAEAPSTKSFGRLQETLCRRVGSNRMKQRRSMAWVQVVHAVKAGLLPEDVLHTVQVQTTGPSLVVRDQGQEAATNKTYCEMRVKSRQTIQAELGLDPKVEESNFEKDDKRQQAEQERQAQQQAAQQPGGQGPQGPTPGGPGPAGEPDGGPTGGGGTDPNAGGGDDRSSQGGGAEGDEAPDAEAIERFKSRFVWSPEDIEFEGKGLAEGDWQETKHPRDHGKFSSSPGQQGEEDKPAGGASQGSGRAELGNPVVHAVHATTADADTFAKQAIQQESPLTPDEQAATEAYRNTAAVKQINGYLRGTPTLGQRVLGLGGKNKEIVKNIDAAIAKSKTTQPMTVMRGMKLPPDQVKKMFGKSRIFTDKAFVSTTLAGEVVDRFSDSVFAENQHVVMAIHVPEGTNGHYMPRQEGDKWDEAEFLLPRGSRFAVHSVEQDGNTVRVQARYLPPEQGLHESTDSTGHEHGADGKFASKGGGGAGAAAKEKDTPAAQAHAQNQKQQRKQAMEDLDKDVREVMAKDPEQKAAAHAAYKKVSAFLAEKALASMTPEIVGTVESWIFEQILSAQGGSTTPWRVAAWAAAKAWFGMKDVFGSPLQESELPAAGAAAGGDRTSSEAAMQIIRGIAQAAGLPVPGGDAAEPADTKDLAELYAELWAGKHPHDLGDHELATAHEELAGGDHTLDWDEPSQAWRVLSSRPAVEAAFLEGRHEHRAPKGGITIAGKQFRGGMFIPAQDYAKASKAEKKRINNPAQGAADTRVKAGSPNLKAMQDKLAAQGVTPPAASEGPAADNIAKALKKQHGPHMSARVEELVRQFAEQEQAKKNPGVLAKLARLVTSAGSASEDPVERSKDVMVKGAKQRTQIAHLNAAKDALAGLGVKDLWNANLQTSPELRAAGAGAKDADAFNAAIEPIEHHLTQALRFSADNSAAFDRLKGKLAELQELKADVARYHAELTPETLPDRFGKRGQGKANVALAAFHLAGGADPKRAVQVLVEERKLSKGTAQRYVRQAVKTMRDRSEQEVQKLEHEQETHIQEARSGGATPEQIAAAIRQGEEAAASDEPGDGETKDWAQEWDEFSK